MTAAVRRGLTAVAVLAAGAALAGGGLAAHALASPSAAAAAGPKAPAGSGPTITIRVGGVRTAENGPPGPARAVNLAGATFRAFPLQYGAPGEKITYTYTVTNTGNVTLHDVTLADDRFGHVGCPATVLAPGASMTCHAVKVTTQADVAKGQFTNVATVTGEPPAGPPVTDADTQTVYAIHHPGIAVAKSAVPSTYSSPGTAITYTYTVVNTGDVTLHDVMVADDRLGLVSCAARTLAPGAATTCRAVYITTLPDVTAGRILNLSAAAGRSPGGAQVTGKAEAVVWAVPLPVVPVTD
jgi:hypothetical protein